MIEEPQSEAKGARAQHRLRAMELLRQHGPMTHVEMGQRTGLSRATVSLLVNQLRADGLLNVDTGSAGGVGRPPSVISLNPSIGTVVGIDFGQAYIQVALADLALKVLHRKELVVHPLPEGTSEESQAKALQETLENTSQLVGQVLDEAGKTPDNVIGIGMAIRAPVNRIDDIVYATTFIRGWKGFRPAHDMGTRLGLPVVIDNDCNVCALAETMAGDAKDCTHALYIKTATGVGCGIIIDSGLYRGSIGTAGEIGHNVADEDGEYCYCGNRGCLHTIVGAKAIADRLRPYQGARLAALEASWNETMVKASVEGKYDMLLSEIINWAQDGEPACRRVLEDVGRRLGVAVGSACNLLNPQCVIIGGTLSKAGGIVIEPLQQEVSRYATVLSGRAVRVRGASLPQGEAEIIGALTLGLREPDRRFSERLRRLVPEMPLGDGASPVEEPHSQGLATSSTLSTSLER